MQNRLYLGNLEAKSDWGYCPRLRGDEVAYAAVGPARGLRLATGEQYSVRDFVNAADEELGIQIRWEGENLDEKGYCVQSGGEEKQIVAVDPS